MTQIPTPVETIPPTFEAAVDTIITHEGFAEAADGSETAEDFAAANHRGAGRYIRNHWSLWTNPQYDTPLRDHMLELGFTHADDMSSAILQGAWCKHHGLEFDLEASVQEFKEYWENMTTTEGTEQ